MSLTAQRDEGLQRTAHRPVGAAVRYAPAVVLAVFVVVLMLGNGVGTADLVRYALYWAVAVVLPGLVVGRSLLGVRATVVEDLAIAGVTGVSLEVLSWVVGVTTGLGGIVRFWWVPVLAAGALVPALRRRVLVRVPERVPVRLSVALAVLAGYLLAFVKVNSYVFRAPLPPHGGTTYVDMWWQLSLVQELAKYQPPQVPQVAGEPFGYHYFANVQMASGVRLSGVAAEVVTFRLWFVPIIVLCVGMAVVLGRALTRSLTAGVVLAGLTYAVVTSYYLWPSALAPLALSPLASTSPSQLLADVGISACAFGAVLLFRGGARRPAMAWVVLVVVGASADKSTVLPILLAGTVVATGRAVVTRSWAVARWLGVAVVGLLGLQAVVVGQAAGTAGGKLTVLGPLRFLPVFDDLVPARGLRATNHGLLLDSIMSARTAGYAVLAVVVVLGVQLMRLAGVAGLFRRSVRSDYATWWLAGGTLAGYAAMLSIDHVGVSQTFFGMAGGLLGIALTVVVLWDALRRLGLQRGRLVVGAGLLAGCLVTLLVEGVAALRESAGGYGAVEQAVTPLVVVVVVAVVAVVVVAALIGRGRARHQWRGDVVWAAVFATLIGIAVPSTATVAATTVAKVVTNGHASVDAPLPNQVTSDEQRAALWLRSHSATDDVAATNAYCVEVVTTPDCDARGFWLSALSGRRVALEGWAYTTEAQSRQGVGGLPYFRQPSPFPARFRLDHEVFTDSSTAALGELRSRYDVRWLVSVHRAGPTPSFPDSVAAVRFENQDVTIFEVLR